MQAVGESESTRVSRLTRVRAIAMSLCTAGLVSIAGPASAGADFKIGDDAGLSAGIGLRTSFTKLERGAPNGTSSSNDFAVDNVRLFFNGHYGKVIKATFNTERTGGTAAAGGDSVRVMDAIAQFEFMDEFNVWMGRMLPPSDRANLYGPFYALPWAYPGVASNYPNLAVGRDNGLTIWGKLASGKFTYSVGAFEGHNKNAALGGASDKLAFSGRLQFNAWDVEPAPAYYTGGWYGGSKDILSVAFATYNQQDGVGTAARPGNLSIYSMDMLFEKKYSFGVPTIEAAYYKYNLGALDCGSGEPGSPVCPAGDNIGGQVDGTSYLLSGGWMLPQKVGIGNFQPYVRYQQYNRSLSNTKNKATDFGVNYIMKGPNAKLSATYSKLEDNRVAAPLNNRWQFVLGAQLIY